LYLCRIQNSKKITWEDFMRLKYAAIIVGLITVLSACKGRHHSEDTPTYKVGGMVSQLSASKSLVLLNNGGDATKVSANGAFSFPTVVEPGSAYKVTIGTQPAGMTCRVENPTGSAAANVINVEVTCYKNPAFVYVANLNSKSVSAYKIDATTGKLTFGGDFPTGERPNSVKADPTGKFVYVVFDNDKVWSYKIDPHTGDLVFVDEIQTGSGPDSTEIDQELKAGPMEVDPTGKFVYIGNSKDKTVSAYQIGPTGALTLAGIVHTGKGRYSIAVDRTATYAYVANQEDAAVWVYKIDATNGALTSGRSFSVDKIPSSVTIDPTGRFIFVVSADEGSVSTYKIDAATGDLANQKTASSIDSHSPGVVDPTGRFFYFLKDDRTVSSYEIVAVTGALSFKGNYTAGLYPTSMVVDSTGKFAYVLNFAGSVSAYTINDNSGELAPVGPNVNTTSTYSPISIAIAPLQ
jgi:6-phosphogluconolactonase (cycloisomerase 2 family)